MIQGFIDKSILFLFCLLAFPFHGVMPECVFACLLAVTVSACLHAFPGAAIRYALLAACGLLAFFLPQLCIFFPLLAYDLLPVPTAPYRLGAWLLMPGSFLYYGLCEKGFGGGHPFLPHEFRFLLLLSGCALGILLRLRTDAGQRLRELLLKTRDDDTEIRMLLEERNRSLLEKQDNEIYTATLQERNRIAREIHDNVGHLLTRAILMTGALKAVRREPELAGPLGQLGDTLNCAMDSIRSSVHDLHESSVTLEDALRAMTQEFSFCPVSLQCQMPPDLPREIKYHLIAIAREALVNIARHSNATSASITAIEHPGFYQFIIQDNGDTVQRASGESRRQTGMEKSPAMKKSSGMRESSNMEESPPIEDPESSGIGLGNIRSRVRALRGNLQIRTQHGFRIYITIPRN